MKLVIGFLILVLTVSFFLLYRYFTTATEAFLDLGDSCNPQIENTCGKEAVCQSDDSTSEKGVCFPKPTEEKEAIE